jgi:hypothetical protein
MANLSGIVSRRFTLLKKEALLEYSAHRDDVKSPQELL